MKEKKIDIIALLILIAELLLFIAMIVLTNDNVESKLAAASTIRFVVLGIMVVLAIIVQVRYRLARRG